MASDIFTFSIPNWEKFNPRSDRANYTWFRFQNDFFHDQSIFGLPVQAKLLFVFLACEYSKKAKGQVAIRRSYASAMLGISENEFTSFIECLIDADLVEVEVGVAEPSSRRHHDGSVSSLLPATYERTNETDVTNETDETIRDSGQNAASDSLTPKVLVELWNAHCEVLPKVRELSESRKSVARTQIKKYPDEKHWLEVLKKFTASKFCRDEWKPGFDDFLHEGKRLKAIEGKYDDKTGGQLSGTYVQKRQAGNLALLARVEAGEL